MLKNNDDDYYTERWGKERLGSLLLLQFIAYVVSKTLLRENSWEIVLFLRTLQGANEILYQEVHQKKTAT